MKVLLTLYLVLSLLQGHTQKKEANFSDSNRLLLVAKNSKHTRLYENDAVLKIHYRIKGKILKTKGRLHISNQDQIQLVTYRKKKIIAINTADISSIGLWKRGNKITAAVIGATAGVFTLSMIGKGDALTGIGVALLAGVVALYEVIEIPAFLINEKFSIRSEKKGYHFFMQSSMTSESVHLRH